MAENPHQHQTRTAGLITGASSGIGRALAKVLARHGHDLVLVARDAQRLAQLANELQQTSGITAMAIPADLSITTSPQNIFAELHRLGIKISLLVNNAGFDVFGEFFETDLKQELQMIQVNLVSVTQLTKLVLPGMRQQGYGQILNLGSTGSFVPSPLNAVYSATKAYVLSFSEAISEELQGSGITVTALCPGATESEFHQRARTEDIPLRRFGAMQAATVAEIGYRAMMAGRRVVVPGLYNQVQVLLARVLPRSVLPRMAKLMLQSPRRGAS